MAMNFLPPSNSAPTGFGTERTMTAHHTSAAARREPSLLELASRPEVDPCDVACEAMPGYVLGDLGKLETAWVHDHTENCRYCREQLEGFQKIDHALDECATPAVTGYQESRPPSVAQMLGLKEARYGFMESVLGPLMIVTTDTGVCAIDYLEHGNRDASLRRLEERGILAQEQQRFVQPVIDQLNEYFAHKRTKFFLPLDLHGVTAFTRSVLDVTNHIGFGQVVTYGRVAEGIGQSGASRAVGNALGRNPVPIVVPCHRVIKSDGTMGWYTGGSHLKHRLLEIEGVHFSAPALVNQQALEI
jgi:methylated-DNA-[protein]-cysteine S-methyltransferase